MVFRADSKLGSILRVATLSMEPNFVYKTNLYLHVSLSFVPDEDLCGRSVHQCLASFLFIYSHLSPHR